MRAASDSGGFSLAIQKSQLVTLMRRSSEPASKRSGDLHICAALSAA